MSTRSGSSSRVRHGAVVASLLGVCLSVSSGTGRTQGAPAHAARPRTAERADLIVAQDGSGDVRSIQAALDAIPADNASLKIVLVRTGTYREKVFVRSRHVAIVGEDRDRTRIEFAELRRNWRASHPDDWGAAVVNVGDEVTDLTIGNLTVENSYGRLHGDHDHQFAIRSGGTSTRIALLHANLIGGGGDTVSLWNVRSGLTFQSNCYFEGWVDYVCPRGWCYIGASRFFGHNLTASLWHDGSGDPDQKFVVRDAHIDGVPGFPLGRFNRDGQFFILDTTLASTVADRPIYPASAPDTYKWGTRTYFHNTRRAGGDFAWHADNLAAAPGTPAPPDVTPAWTFANRWDPEATLPAVLPFASLPQPRDGARGAATSGITLRWIGGRNATRHRVAFGTSAPPPVVGEVRDASYKPGALQTGTTYFWKVDAVTPGGLEEGAIWSFTTEGPVRSASPAPGASIPPPPLVRLVLVGDSTVTDEIGWGRGLRERFGSRVEIANLARNGRSSRSYRAEGHWAEVVRRPADYVLIQFGHNDQPGKGPERESDAATAFREHLGRYVDEAREAGIAPILVTPLARRRFGPDGRAVSDLDAYADAVRAVAAARAVPVIDLHARSVEILTRLGPDDADRLGPTRADGTVDRTHLNERGSRVFGAIVADDLLALLPALVQHTRGPFAAGSSPSEGRPPGRPGPPTGEPAALPWGAVLDRPDGWYGSEEARRLAATVRAYQRASGGWPKNVDFTAPLSEADQRAAAADAGRVDATIDNGATYTPLRFLARRVSATGKAEEDLRAFTRGVAYLLDAQYPNGGWPQYYPLRADYSRHITFNDGAMIGVLRLLRDVSARRPPFAFVDADLARRAGEAVSRGIRLVLACQVRVGGRLTGWGAQHDAVTLAPQSARVYEPASLSSKETVEIVEFFLDLDNPEPAIAESIEAAASWLEAVRLEGVRLEERPAPDLDPPIDRVVVPAPGAPPLWARFYEIGTNRPLYVGRDGVTHDSLAAIEHERRVGYAWIGPFATELLSKQYPRWRAHRNRAAQP